MDLYIDNFDRLSNIPIDKVKRIFSFPRGHWFTKSNKKLKESVIRFVTRTGERIPVCVIYFIPNRDLGSFSKGGARSELRYIEYITQFANGLKDKQAIIIFEPDALPHAIERGGQLLEDRVSLINKALLIIKETCVNARVYIDIGHPRWINPSLISKTLKKIKNYRGVSINVSNFVPTDECMKFGVSIGEHFVIDTSRNGNEELSEQDGWCNPPNRKIGKRPQLVSDHVLLDAYLWIKIPGESDGKENGGPKAGVFWKEYAEGLLNE